MSFSVGDKVRFLNDTGEGIVVEICSDSSILIEDEDGFEQLYKTSDIVEIKNLDSYQLNNRKSDDDINAKIQSLKKQKNDGLFKRKFRHLDDYGNDDFVVIDLHIHVLYERHEELSPAQIISHQMNTFIRELNVSIQKKVKKLIVIHGKGKGVLKREISIELYQNYPDITYQDASFNEYGYGGATEIILSKSLIN